MFSSILIKKINKSNIIFSLINYLPPSRRSIRPNNRPSLPAPRHERLLGLLELFFGLDHHRRIAARPRSRRQRVRPLRLPEHIDAGGAEERHRLAVQGADGKRLPRGQHDRRPGKEAGRHSGV